MSWSTVVLTLGAAGIGAWASGSGVLLGSRSEARRSDAQQAIELLEKGAQVVGALLALLDELEPVHLGRDLSDATIEQMAAAFDEWKPIRVQLRIYAAGHPSREVGALA